MKYMIAECLYMALFVKYVILESLHWSALPENVILECFCMALIEKYVIAERFGGDTSCMLSLAVKNHVFADGIQGRCM